MHFCTFIRGFSTPNIPFMIWSSWSSPSSMSLSIILPHLGVRPCSQFTHSLVHWYNQYQGWLVPDTLKTPGHRENTMEAVPPSRRTLNHWIKSLPTFRPPVGVREDPGGAPIAGAASWAFSSSCSRAGVRMAMGIAQGSGPITPMSGRAGSVTCDTAPGAAQDFGGRLARARGLPQPLCSQLSAQPHCAQELNPGLLYCRRILYQQSHQGSMLYQYVFSNCLFTCLKTCT